MTYNKLFKFDLQRFVKGDTLLERSDIAKAMYIGTKEVFKDVLKKNRREEWKACCSIKKSTGMEETYETIGNLKPAAIKLEGDPVVYGDIVDGNDVVLTNVTVANGLSVTMEANEDEKWGIVPTGKTTELARTMLQYRERAVATVWDGVEVNIGGDGVPNASLAHPLLNNQALFNSNLVPGAFGTVTYELACNLFNGWMNHTGEKFDTLPTTILSHRNRQTEVLALLQSQLVAFELSNTKNTLQQLKPVFNRYIAALPVHIIDDTIDSVVFQRRKGLTTEYDYDKRLTFNWFFNVHERYVCGVINPGFGFVTITGA